MAQRTTDKRHAAERALRVVEYLRRNTDEYHPTTQAELHKHPLIGSCLGAKETSNDLITALAQGLNCDEDDIPLPEEEWRIVFNEFRRQYGTTPRDEDADGDRDEKARRMYIRGLYYQHPFSYEEIDYLIEGVRFSKLLDERTAERIVDKIKRHLTSKYYTREHRGVRKVREPALLDRSRMHENLAAIQSAIDGNRQIVFQFNGYDRSKALRPVGKPYAASPYYIVASGGRYYLIGCPDDKHEMFIWRIDLMTEVHVTGERRVPKREVANLPMEWTDDFQLSHLNMSFDKPVTVRLRIRADNGNEPPYTFLHDWFGDTFRCVGEDEVLVECSPFGMVNWAMQYSDRVEVLAPESVREDVVERVRKMREKYGICEKQRYYEQKRRHSKMDSQKLIKELIKETLDYMKNMMPQSQTLSELSESTIDLLLILKIREFLAEMSDENYKKLFNDAYQFEKNSKYKNDGCKYKINNRNEIVEYYLFSYGDEEITFIKSERPEGLIIPRDSIAREGEKGKYSPDSRYDSSCYKCYKYDYRNEIDHFFTYCIVNYLKGKPYNAREEGLVKIKETVEQAKNSCNLCK